MAEGKSADGKESYLGMIVIWEDKSAPVGATATRPNIPRAFRRECSASGGKGVSSE